MKRNLTRLALAMGLLSSFAAGAQTRTGQTPLPTQGASTAHVNKKDIVPSLMVMSAKEYTFENGKLALKGVSPTTIIFADRPQRLTGSVPTDAFVADWSQGRDSFEKVPPNADLTTFTPAGANNVVVELKNPVLDNDTLTYDVRVLKGKLPPAGGESSLFIDIIGMPMTPMSYAGVARRTEARAAYYSAPHVAVVY